MTGENILTVKDLKVKYGDFEAVRGVSFSGARGEIFGIVGESGSGKSTVARTLIGLNAASGGTIENLAKSTQMIFQDAVGSLNPKMTIRATLEEVCAHYGVHGVPALPGEVGCVHGVPALPGEVGCVHGGFIETALPMGGGRARSPSAPQRIAELLNQVGLSEAVLEQYPRELSGGQCQRVSIARALACNPEILIADEPVSALDVSVQARVLNLLRDLRKQLGLTIILIAHDLAVVKNVCDEIAVMEKGKIVDYGEAEAVFANPKSEYTRNLIASVFDIISKHGGKINEKNHCNGF